jgi:MarR family transcriptional regulator for hemolysin
MRTVRADMRRCRGNNLSVPQFRVLGFIHRNVGTSLSKAAEHIGLTLPAMSRLVDGLVERKLVMRQRHPGDHRFITLKLTLRGGTVWGAARDVAQASLSERLSALDLGEHATVSNAMAILRRLFAEEIDPSATKGLAEGTVSMARKPKRRKGLAL